MSEWVVPVELETGIPLPILPRDNLPPVGHTGLGADTHHLIFPKSRKELRAESGNVLRSLCLEWVDDDDHDSYHHYFDEYMANEWVFPKTRAEKLGMTILFAAQYTPPRAIKVTRLGPQYVELDETERQQLWKSNILRCAASSTVYEFLRDSLVREDISDRVREEEIERFVTTQDANERKALGNKFLALAAEGLTEPIKPTYLDAYKRSLLPPDAQPDPKQLLMRSPVLLGTDKRKHKVRSVLRRTLAKRYDIELSAA